MRCPQCMDFVVPWYWQDGGCCGIRCDNCKQAWWSTEASRVINRAGRDAEFAACRNSSFPTDAVTDEDQRKVDAELFK